MQPMIQVIGTEWHTDYGRGEATTCRVALKNLSSFAGTVYAQVYFGYRAWTIWYDGSSRVWVRFDLPAGGQITRDGHPVVKSDCPYGTMIGQVDVFPQQSRDNMLASAGAPGAVNIVEEPEVHELIHLPVTGMPTWTLDRYYNIDWVRVRLTVDSIQGGTEQRVTLYLVNQEAGLPGVTKVLELTGHPLHAGYVWDKESDLAFFGGVLRTNYIYLGTSWCKIRDIHVWYREAGSASQTQALLSKSYL